MRQTIARRTPSVHPDFIGGFEQLTAECGSGIVMASEGAIGA
jgi:hypothetical protein